jgi:hypothetical protein
MNDLETVLKSVRERIERYKGETIGEENTKNILIEPVLRALGWDVEDLEEVRREYRRRPGDLPVDYALFLLRTPRLFVEAKSLGGNLADHKSANQLFGYSSVAGCEWAVLTDGNEYRIYNVHGTGPEEEKLFRQITIASGDSSASETLALLSKGQLQENQIEVLWRADSIDRKVKGAIEVLFAPDVPVDFLHLIRKRVPDLQLSDLRASLARARLTLDYPAAQAAQPPAAPIPVGPGQRAWATRRRNLATDTAAVEAEQAGQEEPSADKTPWRHVTLQDLTSSGTVRLPLDIETAYKGHQLTARIEADGNVTWNGTTYDSLSIAGAMARKSIVGAPPGREYPPTNGWTFWRFRDSDGRLALVDALRQRHLAK